LRNYNNNKQLKRTTTSCRTFGGGGWCWRVGGGGWLFGWLVNVKKELKERSTEELLLWLLTGRVYWNAHVMVTVGARRGRR